MKERRKIKDQMGFWGVQIEGTKIIKSRKRL